MSPRPPRIRLLWQSSTTLDSLPAYLEAIREHSAKVLSATTDLQVCGVTKGVPELHFRSIDFLNNVEVLRSVLNACDAGVDAVALGCFVDPLLDELREILQLPVLGMAETSMHLACLAGRRFAILSRTAPFAPKFHQGLVARYGLTERCAGVFAFDIEFSALVAALEGSPQQALEAVERTGREAVAAGAEVLLLGCGILNLVAMRANCREIAGARVLDTTGMLMKMAETLVELKQSTGFEVSRKGLYASPDDETLNRALRVYGLRPPM